MKKLYSLLIITLLLNTFAFSQSFIITPTESYEANIELNTYTNHQVDIINQTTGEITLVWERDYVDMPEEWTITLCDYGSCNIGIPEAGQMYPIFDSLFGFLKLSINPHDIAASGTVTFKVWDDKYPDLYEYITFTINAGGITGIGSSIQESSFSVYPNPASDNLLIKTHHTNNCSVSLVNVQGQVVKHSTLSGGQERFNISELQQGMYFVLITDQSGILERKKIMIQ